MPNYVQKTMAGAVASALIGTLAGLNVGVYFGTKSRLEKSGNPAALRTVIYDHYGPVGYRLCQFGIENAFEHYKIERQREEMDRARKTAKGVKLVA